MISWVIAACLARLYTIDSSLIRLSALSVADFIAIILAAGGILNPVAGALVHNAGSVVVIANSVFLLKWRRKNA